MTFVRLYCLYILPAAALPPDSYEQAKVLAPLFNTLVDKISRDGPWLKEVLADVLVRIRVYLLLLTVTKSVFCLPVQSLRVIDRGKTDGLLVGVSCRTQQTLPPFACGLWYVPGVRTGCRGKGPRLM